MAPPAQESATAALVSWVQDFRTRNKGRQPSKAEFPPDIGERFGRSVLSLFLPLPPSQHITDCSLVCSAPVHEFQEGSCQRAGVPARHRTDADELV